MYQKLIATLSQGNTWVSIQPPCPDEEIERAERAVGYRFPQELRALLREMDGDKWCLLSVEEIIENVERNRAFLLPLFEEDYGREAYEERVGRFIFFATNGCGDYYCYRVRPDGVADESAIYLWENEGIDETCCWRAVASDMAEFITRYYKGVI